MEIGVLVSWFGLDIAFPNFSATQWLLMSIAALGASGGLASVCFKGEPARGIAAVICFTATGTVLIATIAAFG